MCVSFFFATSVQTIFHSDKYLTIYTPEEQRNPRRSSCNMAIILSDFNQNWNELANCSKILHYEYPYKSVQCFLSSYIWTDGHNEANMCIFTVFCYG
jgi:hypothetical protein